MQKLHRCWTVQPQLPCFTTSRLTFREAIAIRQQTLNEVIFADEAWNVWVPYSGSPLWLFPWLQGPCLSSTSQNIQDPPKSYRFWGNIGMIHSKMDFRSTQFLCRSTPESNKNDSRMTGLKCLNGLSVQKDAEKHPCAVEIPWENFSRNPTLAAYAGGIHGVDSLVQGSVLQHQVPALWCCTSKLLDDWEPNLINIQIQLVINAYKPL